MLIAYGNGPCGGNDTAYQTIHFGADVSCPQYFPQNNPMATQTTCYVTLYDSGGPNFPYASDVETEVTIAPTGATGVRLEFREFDVSIFDVVVIYDGPNRSAPLIGSYNGQALPNGGTIISTTGAVTIVMQTGLAG